MSITPKLLSDRIGIMSYLKFRGKLYPTETRLTITTSVGLIEILYRFPQEIFRDLNLSFIEKSLGNRAKHFSHDAKIELCHKENILRSVATFKVSDLSVVFFVVLYVAFVYNCCHHDQLLLPRCLWMDGDGRGNAVLESCQSIQCHYKQEIFLWICLG